jgi:hypothetical protein
MAEDQRRADGQSARQRRLAEALRQNLLKRKAQMRSRREGEADTRDGLPAAGPGDSRPAGKD